MWTRVLERSADPLTFYDSVSLRTGQPVFMSYPHNRLHDAVSCRENPVYCQAQTLRRAATSSRFGGICNPQNLHQEERTTADSNRIIVFDISVNVPVYWGAKRSHFFHFF